MSKSFPDELAIMEAEAAGDPIGHGPTVLMIQAIPSARERALAYARAILGWLSIAAIVIGAAAVIYGLSR